MTALDEALAATRYQSYVYAYPHKTAYRRIEPGEPLGPLWAGERRDALFAYFHIPFCEHRCGFCNLFTRLVPPEELVAAYLSTLARQATVVRRALDEGGAFRFARAAIGGGTPTLLSAAQLETPVRRSSARSARALAFRCRSRRRPRPRCAIDSRSWSAAAPIGSASASRASSRASARRSIDRSKPPRFTARCARSATRGSRRSTSI